MNRYRIIVIGALIAGILWVLAIADGARLELAKGNELVNSLKRRVEAQTRENERLRVLLKAATDSAADRKSEALAKLRSEMTSLHELTNSLGKKLVEARQAQPARKDFKRSGNFLGGVTVVSDSDSPQYEEQLSKIAMDRTQHPEQGDARNLRHAILGYEQAHGGMFPDNLQAVAQYAYQGDLPLAGTIKERDPMAGVNEFDLVFQGSMNDLANVPANAVALLRQQQAWPTPSGKSARIYLMAGGKVEVVESDDNFQAWEAEYVVPGLAGAQ